MRKIDYNRYEFTLSFEKEIVFKTNPVHVFRSAIGMNLRQKACIQRNLKCETCIINKTCVYSWLFESHIDKDNTHKKGTNRASHPFVIQSVEKLSEKRVVVSVMLIGKADQYFPFVYYAISQSGERGVFRTREKYSVDSVVCKGIDKNLLENGNITQASAMETWELNFNSTINSEVKDLDLDFLSPFRYKKEGSLCSNIDFCDVLTSAVRRVDMLSCFYGVSTDEIINNDDLKFEILSSDKNLTWSENSYYSSRQSEKMKFGGVVGTMQVKGQFSPVVISLLQAAEIFQIGKNTGFGLGRVKITLQKGK